MKVNFEKLEKGEVKVVVSLTNQEFEKYHELGFKKVQEIVQVDGFRKGNVPENIIIQKYGEMIILEEMAHLAINETFYQAIINENENKKENEKIIPIIQPQINITKIGKGSDFEYTATFPVVPKVELKDYAKLIDNTLTNIEKEAIQDLQKVSATAKAEDLLIVKDEEVEKVLEDLRKARAYGVSPDHNHDHSEEAESKENGKKEEKITEKPEVKVEEKKELPALDDTFAQSFGEQFKTIEDLRNKIKENLVLEKASKLQDKKRTQVLEKLVAETKIDIPEALIQNELARMKAQTKSDVERYGGKWEEYLTQIKKSEEDLLKE